MYESQAKELLASDTRLLVIAANGKVKVFTTLDTKEGRLLLLLEREGANTDADGKVKEGEEAAGGEGAGGEAAGGDGVCIPLPMN